MKFLIVLFCLVAVDIYLFVLIGSVSGRLVLGLILGTGFLAVLLVKIKGLQILGKMRADLARGVPPTESALDGLLVIVGGILLLLPGVITDFFGLMLMVPGNRRIAKRLLRGYLTRRYNAGVFQASRKWQDIDEDAEEQAVHVEHIEYKGNN